MRVLVQNINKENKMIYHQWQRRIKVFCLGLLFAPMLWAATSAPTPEKAAPDIRFIQKNGVLRVAFSDTQMPPFFMHDQDNHWTGIEVDLAQLVAEQLQVKLLIVPAQSYDDIINLVANGKADMGMGLVSITGDRELRVSFTDPYYTFERDLLVNRVQAAANGWNVWQVVSGIQNTDKPITIATLTGSAQSQAIHKLFPKAKIVEYPDITSSMQSVVSGKSFAALASSPVEVRDFLEHNPKANLMAQDVTITNNFDFVAVAVPWQYFYFKEWLDIYFDFLVQNGTEAKLFQKYNQAVGAGNALFQLQ
jgi:polar amino acid transport system substrate-binding protein